MYEQNSEVAATDKDEREHACQCSHCRQERLERVVDPVFELWVDLGGEG